MINFAVSTPHNSLNNKPSYRLLRFQNGSLSSLRRGQEQSNWIRPQQKAATVQRFCYLKPRDRVLVPQHYNETLVDASDYMIICKSSGYLEIIQDFQYKIGHSLSLEPTFILKCVPEDFSLNFQAEYIASGLEYKNGLLYCCMCSGRIYIFILNLPEDYEQVGGVFHTQKYYKRDWNVKTTYSTEENSLINITRYTGRSRTNHICYYLLPWEKNEVGFSAVVSSPTEIYGDKTPYRASIFTSLNQNICVFHINPIDEFSFFTTSSNSPLMLCKVVISKLYIDFLTSFIGIKKRMQAIDGNEITSWHSLANEMGHSSLFSWVMADSRGNHTRSGSITWEDVARHEGTGILHCGVAWRENETSFSLARESTSQQVSFAEPPSNNMTGRGLRRRPRQFFHTRTERPNAQEVNYQELIENFSLIPQSQLDTFLKGIEQYDYTIDFHIINSARAMPNATPTIFLSESYQKMEIMSISRNLLFSVFKPNYQSHPVFRIDATEQIASENNPAYKCLTSFVKMFIIEDSICLVIAIDCILLVDWTRINDVNNILSETDFGVKIIPCKMGLVTDAIVVVDYYHTDPLELRLTIIAGSLPGNVAVYEVQFHEHSKVGSIHIRDSVSFKDSQMFVDKICLISYQESEDRKHKLDVSIDDKIKKVKKNFLPKEPK